jgi:hypothetical protein
MNSAAFVAPASTGALRAARPLAAAVTLGAASQLAFHGASLGASYSAFVVLLVAAVLGHAHLQGTTLRGRAIVVACLAVAAGAAVTLRASPWSAAFGVSVSTALVALLPVVIAFERDGAARATARVFASPLAMPRAIVELGNESAPLFGEAGRRTLARVALGLAVGAPIAAGFTLLLAFDERFTGVLGDLVEHARGSISVIVGGALAGGALVVTHRALSTKADAAEPTRRDRPYRQLGDASGPAAEAPVRGLVAPVTWSAVVVPTALVFLLYAAVSAPTWFAGHRAIQTTDETYASYLHAGFVQLLVAATLSIGMILTGHFVLRPWGTEARGDGPVPGGARLAVVEVALLVGTALSLVSCAQRLVVYVQAYGATYERLAVGVACAFVFFVVALTAWKAMNRGFRGWADAFVGGAVVFGVACALFDADGTIARINLARGEEGAFVDASYLAGLTCDARPALAKATTSPELRAQLEAAWTPASTGDVRSYRGWLACR